MVKPNRGRRIELVDVVATREVLYHRNEMLNEVLLWVAETVEAQSEIHRHVGDALLPAQVVGRGGHLWIQSRGSVGTAGLRTFRIDLPEAAANTGQHARPLQGQGGSGINRPMCRPL